MEIQTKTPTKIESQVGAFLMSDFPPDTLTYKDMANAVGDFVEVADDPQKIKQLIEELNPYAQRHDKDEVYRQYGAFVKHLAPDKRAEINHIAILFDAYQPFKYEVKKIIDHPSDIIGHGAFSRVHPLQHGSKEYAVRVPYDNSRATIDEVHKHLEAALLIQDLPHMEHIVGASYADGVTIAELAPGKNLGKLSSIDIAAVTEAQLEDLFVAMTTAHERGVGFDLIGDNIMYDPKKGFTAIDVALAEENNPMRTRPTVCLIGSIRRSALGKRDEATNIAIHSALQKLEIVIKKYAPKDVDAFTLLSRYISEMK